MAQDEFYPFDPEGIIFTLGEITAQGFAPGEFVKAEFDAQAVTKTVGGQGAVTATINANRSGKFTIVLVQGSPTNDEFSKIAASNQPRGSKLITKVAQLKDLNGTTLANGDIAWIQQVPPSAFGDAAANRTWVVEVANLQMLTGGAVKG